MRLSTIILNWNRVHLLRRTVESYLATTQGADVELFIVDNASTDGSREYLAALVKQNPNVRVVLLDENVSGEAFNVVVPMVEGEFIHLSENDQEFLPGWLEHVYAAFETFPDLGQLSLFADTPTDEEAWAPRPSHLRFKSGKILYESHSNAGTSSIFRGELFRKHGLTVSNNLTNGDVKLPSDGKLSADVKAAGYWVGMSDRYYVRNLGHLVEEFEAQPDYYRANYGAKKWLGESGWRARIEEHRNTPKPIRRSIVFPTQIAVAEKTTQPVGVKPSRIWSMFDGWTAEVETLEFLYSLVRLVKPANALETGTWLGWSACYVGKAMQANGFGRLVSLEVNPEAYATAKDNVAAAGVENWVELRLESSMSFTPTTKLEFAMFDSETGLREAEFRRFAEWLEPGATVVFHDTAPHHRVVGEGVERLVGEGVLEGIQLPTPRGIFVGRYVVQ